MRAAGQDPATRGDESRHALCALARRNTIAGGPIAALG
ncbi:threonine transporter [Burkholderia cenocepacia]|nr:threonine efflux protein [Burkholderia cenocepacia]PRF91320.1 threonine transporter [Burkholderia cenocepacia]RQU02560.1 threonine transporter [Burkholderia cenocepacia]RQU49918.1 threonine transporter [Burkholderia cenocepacia]RQU56210.1 threonine transporter [Burkholderia cenocepacia]